MSGSKGFRARSFTSGDRGSLRVAPGNLVPMTAHEEAPASPAEAEPAEGRGLERARAVDPQKLLRIAGVTREVLEEARRIRTPETGAVEHLRRVHEQIRRDSPGLAMRNGAQDARCFGIVFGESVAME